MPQGKQLTQSLPDINTVGNIFTEEAIQAGLPPLSRLAWLYILHLEGGSPYKVYQEGNKTRSYGAFQINDARKHEVMALGLKFPDDILATRNMPASEIEKRIRNQVRYIISVDKRIREQLKKLNPQLAQYLETKDISEMPENIWQWILGYYMAAWNAPAYAPAVAKGDPRPVQVGSVVYKLADQKRRAEAFVGAVRMYQTSTMSYIRGQVERIKQPLIRAVAPTSTKFVISGQRYPQRQVAEDKVKEIILPNALQASVVLASSNIQSLREWSPILRKEVPQAEELIPTDVKEPTPYLGALLILGSMMEKDSSLAHIWSILPNRQKQQILRQIVTASEKFRPTLNKPKDFDRVKTEVTLQFARAFQAPKSALQNVAETLEAIGKGIWEAGATMFKEAVVPLTRYGLLFKHMVSPSISDLMLMYRQWAVRQRAEEKMVASLKEKAKSKDMVEREAAKSLIAAIQRNPGASVLWGGLAKGTLRMLGDILISVAELAPYGTGAPYIPKAKDYYISFANWLEGLRRGMNRWLGPQIVQDQLRLASNPEFRKKFREEAVYFFASQGLDKMLRKVQGRYEPTEAGWEVFAASVLSGKIHELMNNEIKKHAPKVPLEDWFIEAQLGDYQSIMPLLGIQIVGKVLGTITQKAAKPLIEALKDSKNFAAMTALAETGNLDAALRLSGAISAVKFSQRLPYYIANSLNAALFPGHLVEKGIFRGLLSLRLRSIGGLSGLYDIAEREGAEAARKILLDKVSSVSGATKIASSIITGWVYEYGGIPETLSGPERWGAIISGTIINSLFDAPRLFEGITEIYKGRKKVDPKLLSHPFIGGIIENIYAKGIARDLMASDVWLNFVAPRITLLNRGITDINQLSKKITGGKEGVTILATDALSIPVEASLRLKKSMENWGLNFDRFVPEARRRAEDWVQLYSLYEEAKAEAMSEHKVKREGEIPKGMTPQEWNDEIYRRWEQKVANWLKGRRDIYEIGSEAITALHALTFARAFANWHLLYTRDAEAAKDMFYSFIRLGMTAVDEAKRRAGDFPTEGTDEAKMAWVDRAREDAVSLFYQSLPAALDIVKSVTAHHLAIDAAEAVLALANPKKVDEETIKNRVNAAMAKINDVARTYMPRFFEDIARAKDPSGIVKNWEETVEPVMRSELKKIYKSDEIAQAVKNVVEKFKPPAAKRAEEKSPWRLMLHRMKALETAIKSAEIKSEEENRLEQQRTATKRDLETMIGARLREAVPVEFEEMRMPSLEERFFPAQSISWAAREGKYIPPTVHQVATGEEAGTMVVSAKPSIKWGLTLKRLGEEVGIEENEVNDIRHLLDYAASSLALAPFTDPHIVANQIWNEGRNFPVVLKLSPDTAKALVDKVSADFNWAIVDAGRIGERKPDTADEVLLVLAPRSRFDDAEIMRFASMVRDIYWTQEIPEGWWDYFLNAIFSIPVEDWSPAIANIVRNFHVLLRVPEIAERLNISQETLNRLNDLVSALPQEARQRLIRKAVNAQGNISSLFHGEFDEMFHPVFRSKFEDLRMTWEGAYSWSLERRGIDEPTRNLLRGILFSPFSLAFKASQETMFAYKNLALFMTRNMVPLTGAEAVDFVFNRFLPPFSSILSRPLRFAKGDWDISTAGGETILTMPEEEYGKFWVYYIAQLQHALVLADFSRQLTSREVSPLRALIKYVKHVRPDIGARLEQRVHVDRFAGSNELIKSGTFVIYPFMFPHIISEVVDTKMEYVSAALRRFARENPQVIEEYRKRFYPDKTADEALTEIERDFKSFLVFMSAVPMFSSNTTTAEMAGAAFLRHLHDTAIYYPEFSYLASPVVFHETLHILSTQRDLSLWAEVFRSLTPEEAVAIGRMLIKGMNYAIEADRALPFSSHSYMTFANMFIALQVVREDLSGGAEMSIQNIREYGLRVRGVLNEIGRGLNASLVSAFPTQLTPDLIDSLIEPFYSASKAVSDTLVASSSEANRMRTEQGSHVGYLYEARGVSRVLEQLFDIYYLLQTGRFINEQALMELPPEVANVVRSHLMQMGEVYAREVLGILFPYINLAGRRINEWYAVSLMAQGEGASASSQATMERISYLSEPTEFVSWAFADYANIMQRLAVEEPFAFAKFMDLMHMLAVERGDFDPVTFVENKILPYASGVTTAEMPMRMREIGEMMAPASRKPYPEFFRNVLTALVMLGKQSAVHANPVPDVLNRITEEANRVIALGTYVIRGGEGEDEHIFLGAMRRGKDADRMTEEEARQMLQEGFLKPKEPKKKAEQLEEAIDVLDVIEDALSARKIEQYKTEVAKRVIQSELTKLRKVPGAQPELERLELGFRHARGFFVKGPGGMYTVAGYLPVRSLTEYVQMLLEVRRAAREFEEEPKVPFTPLTPDAIKKILEEAAGAVAAVVREETEKGVAFVRQPMTVAEYISQITQELRQSGDMSYPTVLANLALGRTDIDRLSAIILRRKELGLVPLFASGAFRELLKYANQAKILHPESTVVEFFQSLAQDDIFVRWVEGYGKAKTEFLQTLMSALEDPKGFKQILDKYGISEEKFLLNLYVNMESRLREESVAIAREVVTKFNEFLRERHIGKKTVPREAKRELAEVLGYAMHRDLAAFLNAKNLNIFFRNGMMATIAALSEATIPDPFRNLSVFEEKGIVSSIPSTAWRDFFGLIKKNKEVSDAWEALANATTSKELYLGVRRVVKEMNRAVGSKHGEAKYTVPGEVMRRAIYARIEPQTGVVTTPQAEQPEIVSAFREHAILHPSVLSHMGEKLSANSAQLIRGFENPLGRMFIWTMTEGAPILTEKRIPGEPSFAEEIIRSYDELRRPKPDELSPEEKLAIFHNAVSDTLLSPDILDKTFIILEKLEKKLDAFEKSISSDENYRTFMFILLQRNMPPSRNVAYTGGFIANAVNAFGDAFARNWLRDVEMGAAESLPEALSRISYTDIFHHLAIEDNAVQFIISHLPDEIKEQVAEAMRVSALQHILRSFRETYYSQGKWNIPERARPWMDVLTDKQKATVNGVYELMSKPRTREKVKHIYSSRQVAQIFGGKTNAADWRAMNTEAKQVAEVYDMIYRYLGMKPIEREAPEERRLPAGGIISADTFLSVTKDLIGELEENGWISHKASERLLEWIDALPKAKTIFNLYQTPEFAKIMNALGTMVFTRLLKTIAVDYVMALDEREEAKHLRFTYRDYINFQSPFTLLTTPTIETMAGNYDRVFALVPPSLRSKMRMRSPAALRSTMLKLVDENLRRFTHHWDITPEKAAVVERAIQGAEAILSFYNNQLEEFMKRNQDVARKVGLYFIPSYSGKEMGHLREKIEDFLTGMMGIMNQAIKALNSYFGLLNSVKEREKLVLKELSANPLEGLKKIFHDIEEPLVFTGERRKLIKNSIDFVKDFTKERPTHPSDRLILEVVEGHLLPPEKGGVAQTADMYSAIYGVPAITTEAGEIKRSEMGEQFMQKLLELRSIYEQLTKAEEGAFPDIVKQVREEHEQVAKYLVPTTWAEARRALDEINELIVTMESEELDLPGLIHLSEEELGEKRTENMLKTIAIVTHAVAAAHKYIGPQTQLPPPVVEIIRKGLRDVTTINKQIDHNMAKDTPPASREGGYTLKQMLFGAAGAAAMAAVAIHFPDLVRDIWGGIQTMVIQSVTNPMWAALTFGAIAKMAVGFAKKTGVHISNVVAGLASALSRWMTNYKSAVEQIHNRTKAEIVEMVRETHGDTGAVIAEEVLKVLKPSSAYDLPETALARHEQVVRLRSAYIGTHLPEGVTGKQMAADIINTTAVNMVVDKATELGRALHDIASATEMRLLLHEAMPVFMSNPANHEAIVMAAATRYALRVLLRAGSDALGKKFRDLKSRKTPVTLIGATVQDPVTGQKQRLKVTDDFEVTVTEQGQRVKKKISDMTILEILTHGLAGKVAPADLEALTAIQDKSQLKQLIEILYKQHSAGVRQDLLSALGAAIKDPKKLQAVYIVSNTLRPIAEQLLRVGRDGELAAGLAVFPEVQAMFLLTLKKLENVLQIPHVNEILASVGIDTAKLVSDLHSAFDTLAASGVSTQVVEEIREFANRMAEGWHQFVEQAAAKSSSPYRVYKEARDFMHRLAKRFVYTRYSELQKELQTKKLPVILGSAFLQFETDLRASIVDAFNEPFNERVFNAALALFPDAVKARPEVGLLFDILNSGKVTPMQLFEALDKQIDGLLAKLAKHMKVSKDELAADFNRLLYAFYRNSHRNNETLIQSFEDLVTNRLVGLVYENILIPSRVTGVEAKKVAERLEALGVSYVVLLDYLTKWHSMKAYLGGIMSKGIPDFAMTEERYFPQWHDEFQDPRGYIQTFLEEALAVKGRFSKQPKNLPKQPFEHPRTGRADIKEEEFRPKMRRALNALITKEVLDKHRPLIRGMMSFAPKEFSTLLAWHLVNALVPHRLADAAHEMFPVEIAEDGAKIVEKAMSVFNEFHGDMIKEIGETDPNWATKLLTAYQSTVLLANPRSPLRQIYSLPYAGMRLARDFNDFGAYLRPMLFFPAAAWKLFLHNIGIEPKLDPLEQVIWDNSPALRSRWTVTARAYLQGAREVVREVLSDPDARALVDTMLDPQRSAEERKAAERRLRGMFLHGGNPSWWKRVMRKISDWGFLALKTLDEAAVLASEKAAMLTYLAHETNGVDYSYQDIMAALHYAEAAAETHHATPLEGYRPVAFRGGGGLSRTLLFIPQVFSQFLVYTFAASENVRTVLGDIGAALVRKDLPVEQRIDNLATAAALISLLQLSIAVLNGIFLGLTGRALEEPPFGMHTREEEGGFTFDAAVSHALGLTRGSTPRPFGLAISFLVNTAFRNIGLKKTLPAAATERDLPAAFQLGYRVVSALVNAASNISYFTHIPTHHANFLQDTLDRIMLTTPKRQRWGMIFDIVHAAIVAGSLKIPELQYIPMGLLGPGVRSLAHHSELPYPAEVTHTFAGAPREFAAAAQFLMGAPSPYGWSEFLSLNPGDVAFRGAVREHKAMAYLFVENTERSSVPAYVAEIVRIIPTLRPGPTMKAVGLLLSPNFYVNIAKGIDEVPKSISQSHPMVYHVSKFYDTLKKETEAEFLDWIMHHPNEFAWFNALWGYDFIMSKWMKGKPNTDWQERLRNTDALYAALVARGANPAVADNLRHIAELSNQVNIKDFFIKYQARMNEEYARREMAKGLAKEAK